MSVALWIFFALGAGLGAGVFFGRRSARHYEREHYIRAYVFSRAVLDALRARRPQLEEKDLFLTARALRSYFLIHLRTAPALVAMPSKVVDDLWHEFILDTRTYERFCEQAFGAFFHHVPAARMGPGVSGDSALRLAWRHACAEENIDPRSPTRLPLLFAIDAKLGIEGGNTYRLRRPAGEESGDGAGGCGGVACAGGGLACPDGNAGCGGGDGGCGGGGGCGGS